MITRENREGEGRMNEDQREQIVDAVSRWLADWYGNLERPSVESAATLLAAVSMLLTDEAEADRTLGAKVRAAFASCDEPYERAELVELAILDALREEGGR